MVFFILLDFQGDSSWSLFLKMNNNNKMKMKG